MRWQRQRRRPHLEQQQRHATNDVRGRADGDKDVEHGEQRLSVAAGWLLRTQGGRGGGWWGVRGVSGGPLTGCVLWGSNHSAAPDGCGNNPFEPLLPSPSPRLQHACPTHFMACMSPYPTVPYVTVDQYSEKMYSSEVVLASPTHSCIAPTHVVLVKPLCLAMK